VLEPRRSQYLRALGIDVYVPRFILPGAAESQPCAWESVTLAAGDAAGAAEINSATNSSVITADTAAMSSAAADVISDVITDVAATVRQRSLPTDLAIDLNPTATRRINPSAGVVLATSSDSGAVVPAPKFALSVVVSSCGILIVDGAPPNSGARSEYLKLLGNILLALRTKSAQPQLDVFLWPAVKHPQLDQGAEAARETLAAYLHNQIQRYAINTVLLLGDAAQQWCAFDGSDEILRCVKSVSALACLQAPHNKRQLWQDIRHLAVTG
jgi:hypothetical protein